MADDGHLGNVLGAVALALITDIEAAVRRATGLALGEATALSAVDNLGDGTLSVEGARQAVGLSQSATVRLVDRLVEQDLVRRGTGSADHRVTTLRLTAKGRRRVAAFRRSRAAVLDRWLAHLSAGQQAALGPLLDELASVGVDAAPAGITEADYRCRWCDTEACGHPERCPVTQAVHRIVT